MRISPKLILLPSLLGVAATLLFIIETLYKAYQLYNTANGGGRLMPQTSVTYWSEESLNLEKYDYSYYKGI